MKKPATSSGSNTSPSSSAKRLPKKLIVQKYGGSSLAEPAQIRDVADRIAKLHADGHQLIVVVSAMGKTTDQLVDLAYKVSPSPDRRELDMLLTTGERVSMALMSMALNDRHVPAISFTGSQAGILTDELHSAARIIDVKPVRVEAELAAGHVAVLAGFQGVSPRTKEITTLGRGGSDTTAVALAAYFKAERCEIRKDVDGVHSADPNSVSGTDHLPHLSYAALLDMTYWGAKVLHYRSVELASLLNIPVLIALAHGEGRSTLIDKLGNGDSTMPGTSTATAPAFEQARILSVNAHKDVRWLHVKKPDLASAFAEVERVLATADLPLPQFLDTQLSADIATSSCAFLITAPAETIAAIEQIAKANTPTLGLDTTELSSVTVTCQGAFASPLPSEVAQALAEKSIRVQKMIFGAMSLTVIVGSADRAKAVQALHDLRPRA